MSTRQTRARKLWLRALNFLKDSIPSFNPQFVALAIGGIVGTVLALIISRH